MFTATEVTWAIAMWGAGESPLLNTICAVGCLCIFVLSCWKSGGASWDLCEKICACAGIFAVLAGLLSQDYHVTIKACVIAYTVGILPTAISALKDSENEPLTAWSAWLLGSVPYLYLQWGDWTFSSIATPIVVVLEEALMVAILIFCSREMRRKEGIAGVAA